MEKYVNVWFWNKIFKKRHFCFCSTPFTIVETVIRGDKNCIHLERGQSCLLGKLGTINMAPSLGIS